jgi:hypothetical protein
MKKQRKDANKRVWLFDEILERCLKTFLEMRYTSQYMRTIDVNELYVHIEWHQEEFDSTIQELSFTFESLGFPTVPDVYKLVPALKNYSPWGRLSGRQLSSRLKQNEKIKKLPKADSKRSMGTTRKSAMS